eukprot:9492620-Pyramimonas_sp.AAC.1
MATADSLIQSIQARVSFVNAQVTAGLPLDQLLANQTNQLLLMLAQTHNLTMADATQAITQGPWTAEQKVNLAGSLSNAAASVGPQSSRPQQKAEHLEEFFTQSDWDLFMSADFSVDPKIAQMAVRMHRLGMACPSEQPLKRAGAILVVCHAPDAASPDDKRT